jgi:hypothetical protein
LIECDQNFFARPGRASEPGSARHERNRWRGSDTGQRLGEKRQDCAIGKQDCGSKKTQLIFGPDPTPRCQLFFSSLSNILAAGGGACVRAGGGEAKG